MAVFGALTATLAGPASACAGPLEDTVKGVTGVVGETGGTTVTEVNKTVDATPAGPTVQDARQVVAPTARRARPVTRSVRKTVSRAPATPVDDVRKEAVGTVRDMVGGVVRRDDSEGTPPPSTPNDSRKPGAQSHASDRNESPATRALQIGVPPLRGLRGEIPVGGTADLLAGLTTAQPNPILLDANQMTVRDSRSGVAKVNASSGSQAPPPQRLPFGLDLSSLSLAAPSSITLVLAGLAMALFTLLRPGAPKGRRLADLPPPWRSALLVASPERPG